MMLVQLSDQNFKRKRKRHRHRQTHLVTPPTEEAHDRSLLRYLTILLQSILSSHYFGELLGKKETKKELNASLTPRIYKEDGQQNGQQIAYSNIRGNSLFSKMLIYRRVS
jgi:aromatic ring-opening dioxygenase LigB subunit